MFYLFLYVHLFLRLFSPFHFNYFACEFVFLLLLPFIDFNVLCYASFVKKKKMVGECEHLSVNWQLKQLFSFFSIT